MIEFEAPKPIAKQNEMLKLAADYRMRPISRYFDEHEHEIPWDFINFMHTVQQMSGGGGGLAPTEPKKEADGKERPRIGYQLLA